MSDIDHDARKHRVLAVASQGGHWDQLMLLRQALDQFPVRYATTSASLGERDGISDLLLLGDANRSSGLAALRTLIQAWRIVHTVRPDIVISTGAMPGLFCLLAGWAHGAQTVWVDSIANTERQSLSGKLAGRFVTLWLTQWEHLARPDGPYFLGAVF